MNYLILQFERGLKVNSLGVIRAALSSAMEPSEGFQVGSHPMMIKFFKGMTNVRPKEFKRALDWNVDTVLEMIISWGPNNTLSLKKLTWKLVMLMALATASRCGELSHLDANYLSSRPDGVMFQLLKHGKNKSVAEFPGHLYIQKIERLEICPVKCMEVYLLKTKDFRGEVKKNLFRSMSKPDKGVEPNTISRWLSDCISEAGSHTGNGNIGHSVRSKAVSRAKEKGMTTRDIINSVQWKSDSVFFRHYYQCGPATPTGFGRTVLNQV